ncbi:hypothetical protein [Sulfolobus sp. E11-6]|nr:hypothetical protein [Sulfolobus sp. E11-6]
MGCQRAELLALLEYIEEECKKRDCISVVREIKERVKKNAMLEAINGLY